MKRNIKSLVLQMTLEEKASLLGGADFWHTKAVERLGIPQFMLSDGPHGLRKQEQGADHLGINDSIKAVCFPAACATAASFDIELMERIGKVIGDECQAEDVAVVLGPAVNIKRSPLCGRNFEYYSEDPYLAGKMAAAYIRGVQSRHVGTSVKHFALNNQETRRMSISAEVDEQTIREIYFPAFEIAVKESQPKSVMCSYNKVAGIYSADNEWLLSDVLRKEWGYKGFVVTDWGAVNDRVQGVRAGMDLEMPGDTARNDDKIVEAVRTGKLVEAQVDVSCERILGMLFDYHDNREPEKVFDREADHRVAVHVETECAVFLENNGILPLNSDTKIVYIGEFAVKPRYQGGGSSHINSSKVTSALKIAGEKARNVSYVNGFPTDKDEINEEQFASAVKAAGEAETAVIFAGLPDVVESEGFDRNDMKLPACQDALIKAVCNVQPNTVVVLHNGAPIEAPWADHVAAVLEMYLGGQGVGEATDRLLFGEANPSGHLAETFPISVEDNPSYLNFPGGKKQVKYAEGIYVGYRYYEKKKMPVRWAFGHGLSYTKFCIKNLRFSKDFMDDETTVEVMVDVANTGGCTGKEVIQLYVSDKNGTCERPTKELKRFAKVELEPNEMKTVSFTLDARALSYYDEGLKDWFAPSGTYKILAGDSSDHITAEADLLFRTKKLLPLDITRETTAGELMKDPRTAMLMEQMTTMLTPSEELTHTTEGEMLGASQDAMTQAMMQYMPLKSVQSFLPVSDEQLEGMIEMFRNAIKKQ